MDLRSIPRTETLDARDIALSLLGAGTPAALNPAGIGAATMQSPPNDNRTLVCVFLSGCRITIGENP
ncbi:MAG: hypothetical protein ACM3PU_00670 [Gemmatimonadota bacterium]